MVNWMVLWGESHYGEADDTTRCDDTSGDDRAGWHNTLWWHLRWWPFRMTLREAVIDWKSSSTKLSSRSVILQRRSSRSVILQRRSSRSVLLFFNNKSLHHLSNSHNIISICEVGNWNDCLCWKKLLLVHQFSCRIEDVQIISNDGRVDLNIQFRAGWIRV